MGARGLLVSLRRVFKPFVMLSAAMAVGCGAVRLGGVLMMFGCSEMFFLWHNLLHTGYIPYLSRMSRECALLSFA